MERNGGCGLIIASCRTSSDALMGTVDRRGYGGQQKGSPLRRPGDEATTRPITLPLAHARGVIRSLHDSSVLSTEPSRCGDDALEVGTGRRTNQYI